MLYRQGKQGTGVQREKMEKELGECETKIHHLTNAVAQGKGLESLLHALKEEESRQQELRKGLAEHPLQTEISSVDEARFKQAAKQRIQDVRGLLSRHVAQSRQILRRLLKGKIKFAPVNIEGIPGYRLTGEGSYGHLLANILVPNKLASPSQNDPCHCDPSRSGTGLCGQWSEHAPCS